MKLSLDSVCLFLPVSFIIFVKIVNIVWISKEKKFLHKYIDLIIKMFEENPRTLSVPHPGVFWACHFFEVRLQVIVSPWKWFQNLICSKFCKMAEKLNFDGVKARHLFFKKVHVFSLPFWEFQVFICFCFLYFFILVLKNWMSSAKKHFFVLLFYDINC